MTNDFNNLLEEDLAGRSLSVGQIVDGKVVQISEDGVFVDIGAKSEGHLELDQIFQEELGKLQIGHDVKVRIIKKVDGEFKLSKKSVDFEEAWKKLLEDKDSERDVEIVVREKVKNGYMATAYQILEGFIHHTNFRGKPSMTQPYKARVLDVNRKARKLVFTRRDILDRERDEALERDYGVLQEGMVIEGVVDKLSPYGAFIKITDNLTGLLHISEFSFDHVKKPSEVLKPGDTVQVKILSIDREKNKISLSRKATQRDPLMMMLPGEELDGKVESLAEFGVFVKLESGVTGLVHVSELSFKKFDHPSDLYKPGDPIRVKVLKVQVEDRRVSLSAKSCERDPWSEVYGKYGVGQAVTGTITQLLQSGVVLKLDEFFEAFVPISEISADRINHPGDVLNEGDEASGVVLTIDSSKRRIRVSLRKTEADMSEERIRVKVPDIGHKPAGEGMAITAGKVTLGDILGGKLDLTTVNRKDDASKGLKAPKEEEAAAKAPVVDLTPPEEQLEDQPVHEELAAEEEPVAVAAEPEVAVEEFATESVEALAAIEAAEPAEEEAAAEDSAVDEEPPSDEADTTADEYDSAEEVPAESAEPEDESGDVNPEASDEARE